MTFPLLVVNCNGTRISLIRLILADFKFKNLSYTPELFAEENKEYIYFTDYVLKAAIKIRLLRPDKKNRDSQ